MIEEYLNVKNSTRNLSDEKFEEILPQLSKELQDVDFHFSYTEKQLRTDWHNLLKYSASNGKSSSSIRVGMKLCEEFFPNFFDIKNSKGESFKSFWNAEKLEKVLRWNRKSHSTPYLSELKRGVYFCNGLTKNTMFRPHLAKLIADSVDTDYVLDPCCGWGGRMLGVVASRKHYIGFEPNPETFENLVRLTKFLNIESDVTLINDGSENMDKYDFPEVGLVLTSPPYFNLEVYHDGDQQSENKFLTYDEWVDGWLADVIKKSTDRLNGISCWNVHNVGKMKLIQDVEEIHSKLGYDCVGEFSLSSSARQSHQKDLKHKKNKDITRVYEKNVCTDTNNNNK